MLLAIRPYSFIPNMQWIVLPKLHIMLVECSYSEGIVAKPEWEDKTD